MRRCALALLLGLLACCAFASAAWADGDPASDILLSQTVFIPSDTGGSAQQQAALTALARSATKAGYPIRVAVIPDAYDLGSVGVLWGKPQRYAEFLGYELSLVYKGPLLVAMPSGFGINWAGHSLASAQRLLATVAIKPGGAGLLTATTTAVQRLAASDGVKLVPSSATSHGGTPASGGRASAPASGGGGVATVIFCVLLGLALIAISRWAVLRRRRRAGPKVPAKPPRPSRRPGPVPLRWAVPGIAVLCCAGAVPVLIISRLRQASAQPSVPTQSAPFTWPAAQRPAPNFRLLNQSGHTVSLAAYRGRPVILTFVDPLCRNLCPLAAHVLNQVDTDLPPSRRPVIIAVSVDIYADTHADLMEDFNKWHLVPQWQWAIGTPKQLAAVWNAYKVGVSVDTKTIAGTTVHYITHDEVAYVVDPAGYERALFVWPYFPQDVEHTLAQVSNS
jgi:protein SCO1/2